MKTIILTRSTTTTTTTTNNVIVLNMRIHKPKLKGIEQCLGSYRLF